MAQSVETQWRLAYDLPPTDPRYLDADEDAIRFDLLVMLANRQKREEAMDPGNAQARDLEDSPDAIAGMLARKSEFMEDPGTHHRLQAAMGNVERTAAKSIRVGRAKVQRRE